jgi:GPH family glycoside/pentoside/hexuronide:cation symporter
MTSVEAQGPTATSAVRDRLPVTTKAAYGLGTALDMWGFWLYPAVAFAVFNIYLGVDAWLVGLALGLIRIYDALADPIAGWVSDNFRSKSGRRRPFILVAGILGGLGLPCLFLVSPGWVEIRILGLSAVFWYMLASSLVFIPIMSLFSVPFHSLGSEMTPDYEERTSIMTYKQVSQKIFEIANFYALKFTNLAWFLLPEGGKNTLYGIQVYTSLLGITMAAFAVVIFLRVPERYYEKLVAEKQGRISIAGSVWATLKCQPFRVIMGMGGAFQLGTSMVGSLGYYTTVYYVCSGDRIVGDNWNFWVGLAFMTGGFFGAPLLNRVAAAIGKKNAVVVAASIGILGYGGSWLLYSPVIPWLQTIASGLMGMAAAGMWMLHGSIGADVVDYDELKTGVRREGSFAACGSYLLKLGNSAGQIVSGLILTWAGFNAAVAVQAPDTIFWIRFTLAAIPIAGFVVAIIVIQRLSLTKERCEEIRLTLEQRRGTV